MDTRLRFGTFRVDLVAGVMVEFPFLDVAIEDPGLLPTHDPPRARMALSPELRLNWSVASFSVSLHAGLRWQTASHTYVKRINAQLVPHVRSARWQPEVGLLVRVPLSRNETR